MRRGHQLVGVWPECPASAKIKTAKISSEESGRFSAKICTSENFLLYGNYITFLHGCMHGYNNSKTANVNVPLQYNIPIHDIS